MNNNPFTLSFGREPKEYIKRVKEYSEIIENFESDNPLSNVFVITGLRGTGKTVLLTSLYRYFDNSDDFVVVDLNTRSNMLEDLAAKIYDKAHVKHRFVKTEFNFSFHGFSITFKGDEPVISISQLLEKMLSVLKKHKKKLIITVDDIDTGEPMKTFIKEFQSLYRQDYPIYLIATGLYDVIDNLERTEGLTFLQRGQKRYLSPLNVRYISASYKEIFNIDDKLANELGSLTKGYAFAYQALGHLFFEKEDKKIDAVLLSKYDYYLEEFVYDRVYKELTEKEKAILKIISIKHLSTNKEIIESGYVTGQEISNYKVRLSKRGICDTSERGVIKIILPRFEEFIAYKYAEENGKI